MGNTARKKAKRKTRLAAEKPRRIMNAKQGQFALAQGLQECFARIDNLKKAMEDETNELNTRLFRIESHLNLLSIIPDVPVDDVPVPVTPSTMLPPIEEKK